MGIIENDGHFKFYAPWPVFGKRFSAQLGEIRQNTEALFPVINYSGIYDKDTQNIKDSRLKGWEFGDKVFHNRYRVISDSDNVFKFQVNTGTELVPIWVTIFSFNQALEVNNFYLPSFITVEQTDGLSFLTNKVIFNGNDFYLSESANPDTPLVNLIQKFLQSIQVDDNNLFFNTDRISFNPTEFYLRGGSQGQPVVHLVQPEESDGVVFDNAVPYFIRKREFSTPSYLWEFSHNFNLRPITIEAYDTSWRRIEVHEVDISDPNVTYFYFLSPTSGNAVVGAYPPDSAKVFTFSSSLEWEADHQLNGIVGATVFDENYRRVQLHELDVSNPNISYFYFLAPTAGIAVINKFKGSRTFSFSSSLEWQVEHGLNTLPINAHVYNSSLRRVYPQTLDISNPNIAYFYFLAPTAGIALIEAGIEVCDDCDTAGSGSGIVTFTDGTVTISDSRLHFNPASFYLTPDSMGNPVVNFRGSSGGGVTDHGALTGLGDDDHPQYLLVDGTRNATGNFTFEQDVNVEKDLEVKGSFYLDGKLHVLNNAVFNTDLDVIGKLNVTGGPALVTGSAPQVILRQTTLSDATGFETQNSGGITLSRFVYDPVAFFWNLFGIFALHRVFGVHGAASPDSLVVDQNGSTGVGTATIGASAKLQVDSTTKGFLPPRMTTAQRNAISSPANGLVVYDTTVGALYCREAGVWVQLSVTGGGVTDHGALTGLGDDDHPQYLLVDGTRNATGNFTFEQDVNVEKDLEVKGSFYLDGKLHVLNNAVFDTNVSVGPPGTEEATIRISNADYDAILKVNDFGGPRDGALILHRHSTSFDPSLVFARSNSNDTSHTIVSNGQVVGRILFTGHTGGTRGYDRAAEITGEIDGTPSTGADMPGRLVFRTTPDGSATPVEALRISQNRNATFSSNVLADGNVRADHFIGGGFYFADGTGEAIAGIVVSETDGNPPSITSPAIVFNSDSFYITESSIGQPIINFIGSSGSSGGGGISSVTHSAMLASSPSAGTVVYNTTTRCLWTYDGTYWLPSGGGPNPLVLDIYEDWVNSHTTSNSIGTHGWNASNGAAGPVSSELNHPGIYNRTASANATLCRTQLYGGSTTSYVVHSDNVHYMCWVARPTLTAGTLSQSQFSIGLYNNQAATPNSGTLSIEFVCDGSGAGHTNWYVRADDGTTTTLQDTGVAFSAGSWIKFEVYRAGASTLRYYIDGTLVYTQTTSIPSAAMYLGAKTIRTVTATPGFDFDMTRLIGVLTR